MALRVPVNPKLISWAIERSRKDPHTLYDSKPFKDLPLWESETKLPTYKQLEAFARATYTPLGYFFLNEPPVEKQPLPDFRTIKDKALAEASPNLRDTIYLCQRRQEWYKTYAEQEAFDKLLFVGSVTIKSPVIQVATKISQQLQFAPKDRKEDQNWTAALRRLIDTTENAGVLVMVSSVVGSNTSRKLDPNEFRGFALADNLAPVIFVNGSDTKAAQIFTLVHEMAHLWLGQSALTNSTLTSVSNNETERWCNEVAAEVLVPLKSLKEHYLHDASSGELDRLAKMYKVSTLVVLRRIYDAGFLNWDSFRKAYIEEESRVIAILDRQKSKGGGSFYQTKPLQISQRFTRAIVNDVHAGNTLHRDAFRLVGTSRSSSLHELGQSVGAL